MKQKVLALLLAALLLGAAGVGKNAAWRTAAAEEQKAEKQDSVLSGETEMEEPAGAAGGEPGAEENAGERNPEESAGTGAAQEKEQPFLFRITADDPSVAYVQVTMDSGTGLLPLPVEGEYLRTLRQTASDGTEAVNVLHLTPEGFWMEDANCEGHDCMEEGIVTLENREERVLWNMVVCLPHHLLLELVTREEAAARFMQGTD